MIKHQTNTGFTLIEVLLALSILAISLTALLKATSSNVIGTRQIKEKTMAHIVALNALAQIQMQLVPLSSGQETTKPMTLFDHEWYWHARVQQTSLLNVQRITITVGPSAQGPFRDPLIGFQGTPP